ncbi:protoporphyrinogen oxidase [Flammeovirgaceae bacterium SG7u.111]|nr:protoporphyrinogen oxidase [Flammeovirgaceae bacterium SG7u.132]WPO33290.1 protoporphyrinogen oxidase [Flammeovirgaceae bacterium SG7u.111]
MIAIIGAGISGLSVAYQLHELGIPYQVFEAASEPGGYIKSFKNGDYLLEAGPNTLLADEEVDQLVDKCGAGASKLMPEDVSKKRFVFKKGKYQKLPAGPAFLFSGYFSWKSKMAVFRERKKPAGNIENESVGDFFERRFSKEIVDYAVNPFMAGIYAGDPYQLLVEKTFPSLSQFEKEYGSVIKGFMKGSKGKKSTGRKNSYSFTSGMAEIPKGMAKGLSIKYNCPVQTVAKREDKFVLTTVDGEFEADQLVVSSSSAAAGKFLKKSFPEASKAFGDVYYSPMCVLHSSFKKADVGFDLNGFGGLHPKVENLFTAGSLWSSSLFPNRCPEDETLLTTFIGGSQYVDNTKLSEAQIIEKATEELGRLYDIKGEAQMQHLTRWEKAIPQYDKNIVAAWEEAEKLETEGIYVCANWKDGVSVADCMKKGVTLANDLVKAD